MPIQSLLERLRHAPAPASSAQPFARRELAVAVLLIEAAQVDRSVSPSERMVLAKLVRARFALPAQDAARLLSLASGEFAAALDDWVFTEAVRDGFAEDEREEILGMVGEVVYADGQLARFEETFMQRLAQSINLSEAAAERARSFAFARTSNANRWGSEA